MGEFLPKEPSNPQIIIADGESLVFKMSLNEDTSEVNVNEIQKLRKAMGEDLRNN